jgi:hypothetical protein
MNRKNTIKYIDSVVGEVWIDKKTTAFELYSEKEYDKLNELIQTEYKKCYGNSVPVIER